MKKSLFNLTMVLCIGLFASCSQEEIISGTDGGEETISVSAQLPDNITTRALPEAEANHQLRCILEVWDKAEGGKLITRIEKLASEATDGKLQFAFTVPSATNYQCLLWADFIAKEATGDENPTYTDKYYNTTSLKAIDFKATDAGLFNNASADAFCGVVEKNGTSSSLSVTLKRPFTKVTLKDNSDYLTGCKSLAPSYQAPSKYDISTGKVAGYTEIAATGIAPADKTLFSTFIFASADKQKLDKDITIVFIKDDDTTETKTIKAGQISLDQNVENNAEANFSADSDVTMDVDIDPSFPDPNALKIGQFVNKDGSVADAYNTETTIGIIFAVGAQGDDVADNYGETLKDKTIAGYAMALNGSEAKPFAAEPSLPTEAQEAALTSFSGIKLTNGILNYITSNEVDAPLFTAFGTWKETNTVTGANLSPWYIPSYQQLVTFIGYIYGTPSTPKEGDPAFPGNITKNTDFSTAVTTAGAGTFSGSSAMRNILSSSFTTDKKAAAVQITNDADFIKTIVPGKLTNSIVMRPVITVFKADAAN